MREIKFRAWDKINSKWVSVADLDEEIIINPFTSTSRTGQFSISEWNAVHRVAEDIGTTIVLMQFTGLLDKNGIEIYEGDVVECHAIELTESVVVEDIMDMPAKLHWAVLYKRWKGKEKGSIKVIGNIHQNPELLEVEK